MNASHSMKTKFLPATSISPIELLRQVIENVNEQVLSIDLELLNASNKGDATV